MNAIVVGCGDVGARLAALLAGGGHNVVVIDRNPDALRALGSGFNGATVAGLGYDEQVLRQARIESADALAAVTESDNVNIMAAEAASRIFRVPRTVVRLTNPALERTLRQLGQDYVCGTTLLAQALADKMVQGHAHSFPVRGGAEVLEFMAGEAVQGKRVVDVQLPGEFRICLVTRDGAGFIPWRETVLQAGDMLVAVVTSGALEQARRYMARP
jgi:trk system potassium uptake protein TrkA